MIKYKLNTCTDTHKAKLLPRATGSKVKLICCCCALCPPGPVHFDRVWSQGGEQTDGAHAETGHTGRQAHLHPHSGQEGAEQLAEENVRCQEHGDGHGCEEEAVGPGGLRAARHKLVVVQADEKTNGEEGKETTVEYLCNQNYVNSRRWKEKNIILTLTFFFDIEIRHKP